MLVDWFISLGFQTRVDKKVRGGGGGWRGSVKIGLEKEKVEVFAICEETNETSL